MYDLYFTDKIDDFWGEDFEYVPCGIINDLRPDEDAYTEVKHIETSIKLCLVTQSGCFSMQDCTDGVVALAWQDLSELDEYPDEGRLVLAFGEEYDDVKLKLAERQILMK